MKRTLCIILSLLLCFNSTIVTIATSTESNVVSSNKEKVETLNEETNKITNEIMLMNFIGVRLEEIIRTESTVLLKDTIDLIQKGGIKFTTIDKKTQSYLQSLFDSTTNWKLEEMDRNRLLYNYSQRESRAMSEALKPGVMALLTTAIASATTKDPLTAVLSIGSLVADGVSSYYGSIEQSEQDYDEGNFKLDKERLKTIEGIKKNFFDYCNDMVRDNNIPENMIVYQTKAEKYGENLLESNLSSRLKYFEDNVNLFDGLPSIHLELAKCYFEKGDYKKCVDEIDKYNESNVNIFNNDEILINTFPLAFAAASKYMSSSEYETYVVKNMKYAEELENLLLNGDIKNMLPMFRYKNILVYMDLYGKTNKKEYLDKAYDKCKTNIIPLVREQRKLEEQDRLAINELLINNLEALKAIAEKRGIDNNEKKELNDLIFGNDVMIFNNYPLSEHYYFGDYSKEKYDFMNSIESPYINLDDDSKLMFMYIDKTMLTKDVVVMAEIGNIKGESNSYTCTFDYPLKYLGEYINEYNYYPFRFDIDDNIDSSSDKIKVKVNVIPKENIDIRKIEYNVDMIKMPFGSKDRKGVTKVDFKQELLDLGFNEKSIYYSKDLWRWRWEDDNTVNNVYCSNGNLFNDEATEYKITNYDAMLHKVVSFDKGDFLSLNQTIVIGY